MIGPRRYVAALLAVQLAAGCADESAMTERAANQAEAAPAAAPARPAEQADGKLVLAFGDSLYAGYGVDQDESFPAALERALAARGIAARVANAGVSGDTTASGLQRLGFTLDGLDRNPDLAIVGLGGNDVLRGLSPEETRRNLESILTELQRRGIPVVLTGMLAPRNMGPEYVQRFDAIFPDLARRYEAELYPFFLDGVITRPGLMLDDGIHPNAEGIAAITSRLAPLVAAELQTGDEAQGPPNGDRIG
jgi:acyl-CoA thioesterase-1